MNIVKHNKIFILKNIKHLNVIFFILNIENNIHFILFFIHFTN